MIILPNMMLKLIKSEEEILKFWDKNKIFEKTLKKTANGKRFIFYEGPPTANGRPGIHHVLARAFKDIIPRFRAMRGYFVARKAGWDTHGLPVELEIEKQLGFESKKDIEKYGIEKFNRKCKESVWKYKKEWEQLTKRIGFWLDLNNPYITYDKDYIESLWWIIAQFHKKGLLEKSFKVIPYCPRCGTSLSSHEVAQGYKLVEDPSIFVKFKIQGKENSYFLVWTTTPWTLPANTALAVNKDLEYAKIHFQNMNETLILAREALKNIEGNFNVIGGCKGADLEGMRYEPLYNFMALDKPAHKVILGDFVSAKEGTAIVHIAPAFGVDDMEMAKKYNLPILITIDEQGKFLPEVSPWQGMFVKDADPLIIENLKQRGLLYKSSLYSHEYPFCWRCKNPLLYFAQSSWFVKISSIKDKLIKNNEQINWHPEHLKHGRFGQWLKEVRDWAFSRKRYWGTPLPIWVCRKCGNLEVISSYKELEQKTFLKNNFYFLRHGQAQSNKKNLISSSVPEKFHNPLTKTGINQAKQATKKLKKEKIDLIFSSELLRARQTAEIVSKYLKIPVKYDARLNEINFGILDGGPIKSWQEMFKNYQDFLTNKPDGGESRLEVKNRFLDFIEQINIKYKNKNILIVSHGDTIWMAEAALLNLNEKETIDFNINNRLKVGSLRKFEPVVKPINHKGEFDPHRPFIDKIILRCGKCGGMANRVEELADVWFDSGAMPFAQAHFPFSCAKLKNEKLQIKNLGKFIPYPADYISEGIDQTRGWFYTLLAISSALDFGPSFKNIISLGHVLDIKGEKMSKSLGNIVSPWDAIEKFGADGIRWFFYSSSTPATSKRYDEKAIALSLRKFLLTYLNIFEFFNLYKPSKKINPNLIYQIKSKSAKKKLNILEKWIVCKFFKLLNELTNDLENFKITSASRKLQDFVVLDLSQWFLRRSRSDIPQNPEVFYSILWNLNKILAPFIPFLTEKIFQELKKYSSIKTPLSVHLEDWPKLNNKLIDEKLLSMMHTVRKISSLGMAQRKEKNIKVRQPLSQIKVWMKNKHLLNKDALEVIKEELNVKNVLLYESDTEIKVILDTKLTPKLIEEGHLRNFLREVQQARKKLGFKPHQKITLVINNKSDTRKLVEKFSAIIKKRINIKKIEFKNVKDDFQITIP